MTPLTPLTETERWIAAVRRAAAHALASEDMAERYDAEAAAEEAARPGGFTARLRRARADYAREAANMWRDRQRSLERVGFAETRQVGAR